MSAPQPPSPQQTKFQSSPPSPKSAKPPTAQGSKNLFQNILFGGIAGVIGQASVFPLYTIKTRLHLYPGRYNSVLHCARKIITHDGIRGLYKGLPPALTGVFPEKAIKLSVNDYLTATFARPDGTIAVPMSMLAGAGAGLCQVIATNPMEMLMINMQSAAAKGKSVNMLNLVRDLGLAGLYRGTPATLLRDIPFSVVFFSMNTAIRQALTDDQGRLPMSKVFFAGVASGSAAAAFSTPADVIKTRLQASAGANATTSKPGLVDAVHSNVAKVAPTGTSSRQFSTAAKSAASAGADKIQYEGILHCARHIFATEGLSGFFAGVGPRILIISPLFGITLWFYDIQRRLQASGRL